MDRGQGADLARTPGCLFYTLIIFPKDILTFLGPVYTEGKRRYFPAVWPLVYTKTPFLSQKTIISKNSGQSGDF